MIEGAKARAIAILGLAPTSEHDSLERRVDALNEEVRAMRRELGALVERFDAERGPS